MQLPPGHHSNSPCDISGSSVILWSYKNTFCVQRKQTILSVFEILPSGKKIFWRMLVTKQLLAAIDFYSIFFQTMQVNGYQQLFYYQDSSQYFLFCSTEEWNVFRLGTEPTHRRQILYTPMKYLHTVILHLNISTIFLFAFHVSVSGWSCFRGFLNPAGERKRKREELNANLVHCLPRQHTVTTQYSTIGELMGMIPRRLLLHFFCLFFFLKWCLSVTYCLQHSWHLMLLTAHRES